MELSEIDVISGILCASTLLSCAPYPRFTRTALKILAKKTRRKTSKSTRKKSWLRRLWPYGLLLACIGLAVLAVYSVFLDFKVRDRFEGTRWTLPAKVYAQPLELYVGEALSQKQLLATLNRQGYRRGDTLGGPGGYRQSGSSVDIHTRSFKFWDGDQEAQKIRVSFSGDNVRSMERLEGDDDIALMRLDPMLIGSIYPAQGEDRILIKLGDVPPMLPAGLIVVEDRQFLDHHGVSPKAILRAALANARAGRVVQGGSTITQQLVKNFYLSNQQTLIRKGNEAIMAVLLDAHYSKEAILEAYLNEVYLGQDGGRAIHGFGLASYFYFKKPLEELQPQEVALLVGMVKGPSYYNPRRHPERAESRRNLVLDMFNGAGFIDDKQTTLAKGKSLGVEDEASRGTTQYPAFIDLVRRQLQGQYRDEDLTEEGLRIFTTLDPQVQSAVEERVSKGVADLEKSRNLKDGKLQSAAVVTSAEGGRVLGLVGGRDTRFSGFNRALDARRPIGSLMKPVVYLTALDQPSRYNVLTPIDDGPLNVKLPNGDVWRPQNFDHRSHGQVPLYQGLVHSYNLATSRLALEVGIPEVIKTLKKLGYNGDPIPVPSLALGAVDMSPLEVAQIYNTLAAGGFYTPLLSIRAVTTREGEQLSRYPLQIRRAVDDQSLYLLNWIMQKVVRDGTAQSAYYTIPKRLSVAGKTGTTDGLRDSWFAGYAQNRVAVVWVGRDDNTKGAFTGSSGALQLWARIMRDMEPNSFDPLKPEGVKTVPLLLGQDPGEAAQAEEAGGMFGLSSRRDCESAVAVPFMSGYIPDSVAPCESAAAIDSENSNVPGESGAGSRDGREKKSNWFMDLFQ